MSMRPTRVTYLGMVLLALFGCDRKNPKTTPSLSPPLRLDLAKPDMSYAEVEALLGKPASTRSEPEDGLEAWTYYEREENLSAGTELGGLTVVFKNGRVYRVMPIAVIRREVK